MEFIEAAHHWDGREGQSVRYLIIHATAGGTTAVGIANYFATPTTEASTHYVVGVAGDKVQCVQESDAAWANGDLTPGHNTIWDALNGINPNLVCISIEHCKPSLDNSDLITEAQKIASFSLIKDICTRNNIPTRWADEKGGIAGHYSLDPVERSDCPGPFPWAELFAYLNPPKEENMLELTDLMGNFYTQTGTSKWTCKINKLDVLGAILIYYRMIMGACRLPQTPEQYNIPGVVWQRFESGILVYDPQQKLDGFSMHNHTYMIKLDSDIAVKILYGDKIASATAATAAAIAAKSVSDARVLELGKQVSELQAAQPINKLLLGKDLATIQTALTDALNIVK